MRDNLLMACLLSLVAFSALAAEFPLQDPKQEARAETLFHQIRCTACQSESVAESPADVASDIRTAIRKRIAAGDSNDEVQDYLKSRYGDTIMMRPPVTGNTVLLWFGPTVILVLGIIVIWVSVKVESIRNK